MNTENKLYFHWLVKSKVLHSIVFFHKSFLLFMTVIISVYYVSMITLIRPLLFSNILFCFFQAALETKHKMGPAADRIYLIHFNDVYDIESGDKVSFLEVFFKVCYTIKPLHSGPKEKKSPGQKNL